MYNNLCGLKCLPDAFFLSSELVLLCVSCGRTNAVVVYSMGAIAVACVCLYHDVVRVCHALSFPKSSWYILLLLAR